MSVVGIGLNVNQKNFEKLPNASSLYLISNAEFDKNLLLNLIVEKMKQRIESWQTSSDNFWKEYFNSLFRKGIPMPFKNLEDKNFMGIIQGVSAVGKIQILLEDDTVSEFDIKEIQMLY